MGVEFPKMKPGIRTSLNKSGGLKTNFTSEQKGGTVTRAKNSTASSATTNLSKMSLSSGDWSSKTGAILNNSSVTSRTANSTATTHTSNSTTSSSTGRPSQGSKMDNKYVAARRAQEYMRDRNGGAVDWGFSRPINMSGYGGRAYKRIENSFYAATHPTVEAPKTSKLSDLAATATSLAGLVSTGKSLWDAISGKGGGGDSETGNVTDSANTNIKNMKGAKDSKTLDASIKAAKADKASAQNSVNTLETELSNAKTQSSKLEADYTTAESNYNSINTQVAGLENSINQTNASFQTASASYQSAKNAYDTAPAEPADVKKQLKDMMERAEANMDKLADKMEADNKTLTELKPKLQAAKTQMDDTKAKLDANKKIISENPEKIKTAKATIAAYDKSISKAEKELKKIEKKEAKAAKNETKTKQEVKTEES